MNILTRMAAMALICVAGGVVLAQAPGGAADNEGLVTVKARNVDKAWLLPGADFRPYKKVLLKNAEVAFQKNWLRDNSTPTGSRIPTATQADAQKVVQAVRAGFDEIWAQAFKSAGYEIVAAPGEDVLQVSPRIVNLYINAPTVPGAGSSRSYTLEAGEATLHMDVRDSRAGTLLGRVSDRRETSRATAKRQLQSTDAVTNRAEFGALFATWARIAVKGLEELKANSPLPEKLQPGQKVAPR